MLKSMTGFGAGAATVGREAVTIEAKSVNHRFCEVKVRVPREFAAMEPTVTRMVRAAVTRGVVDVTVRRSLAAGASGMVPIVDVALGKALHQAALELAKELQLPVDFSLRDLLSRSDVLRMEEAPVSATDAASAVEAAATQALASLVSMRQREGEALTLDLTTRLSALSSLIDRTAQRLPEVVSFYRDRLTQRLRELGGEITLDPQRIAQEVVLYAERCDCAEELTRLRSHLLQFEEVMKDNEAIGRKLDFLTQELNREVNTLGSKNQNADIGSLVVEMKVELERIREQVQNVE